jgi:hypothetical protein
MPPCFKAWARSSVGKSARLISVRSVVRFYSGPPSRSELLGSGDVAQLGERGLCKPEVVGSNPIISTNGLDNGQAKTRVS